MSSISWILSVFCLFVFGCCKNTQANQESLSSVKSPYSVGEGAGYLESSITNCQHSHSTPYDNNKKKSIVASLQEADIIKDQPWSELGSIVTGNICGMSTDCNLNMTNPDLAVFLWSVAHVHKETTITHTTRSEQAWKSNSAWEGRQQGVGVAPQLERGK